MKYYLYLFLIFFCSLSRIAYSAELEISGVDNFDKQNILNIADTYNFEDKSQLNDFIKKIYAKGIFTQISIKKENGIFKLKAQENPIVSKISFDGLNKMPEKELKEFLDTKEGKFFSRDKLKIDIIKIKSSYKQMGYLNVKLETSFIKNDDGAIEVTFEIKEGEQVKVKNIEFIGNNQINDFILYDKIDSRDSFLNPLSSKYLSFAKVENDKQLIIKEYLKRGFIDIQVDNSIISIDKYSQKALLSFNIREGNQFKITQVNLNNEIKSLESKNIKILNMFPLRIGELYNQEEINTYISDLKRFLSNFGFISVDVSVDYEKKSDNELILTINIKKSQNSNKFYVRKINIIGNKATKDYVIRRELTFLEGEMYNKDKIEESKDKVTFLGYFEKVEIKEKVLDNNLLDIDIIVKEQFFGTVNFQAGYSTFQGLIAMINLNVNNVLGTGYGGSIGISRSSYMESYSLGFVNPRIFNSKVGFGVNTSFSRLGNIPFIGTSSLASLYIFYQNLVYSASSYLNFELYNRLRWQPSISYSFSQMLQTQVYPFQLYDYIYGTRNTIKFGHTLIYDKRNLARYATSGFYIRHTDNIAGITNQKFFQHESTIGLFIPFLNEKLVLSFDINFNQIINFGSKVPGNENLYSMGYTNLRGFSFFGVGPRIVQDLGNGQVNVMPFAIMAQNSFYGTIDLSSPLFLPKDYGIKFSVFCDFGALWGAPASGSIINSSGYREYIYDPFLIRVSIGAGIVWYSPMGEIRLDFAQPIVKGPYDTPMLFNLRMGQIKF